MIKKRCRLTASALLMALVMAVGIGNGGVRAEQENVYEPSLQLSSEESGSTELIETEEQTYTEEQEESSGDLASDILEETQETSEESEQDWLKPEDEETENVSEEAAAISEEIMLANSLPEIQYCSHVQYEGWQKMVSGGNVSGSVGLSRQMEALSITLSDESVGGDIEYRSHIQYIGWENYWSAGGEVTGTEGRSLWMEAIQIRLTGELEELYDIYYRVHCQDYGWLDWAKNGQPAGTEGYSKRMEAIQIVLVNKGAEAPGATANPYYENVTVQYRMCLPGGNWQGYVTDGALSGTSGQSMLTEAVSAQLSGNSFLAGDIEYRAHIQDYGWLDWKSNGDISGKPGEKRRLEAIEIRLSGDISDEYDIYYRSHIQDFGWTGWAKNGESCGSEGYSKRLEALEIQLVPKGEAAPGSVDNVFYKPIFWGIDVSSYQGSINWAKAKADGVDFAMLRVTKKNTTGTAFTLMEDPYFKRNAQGALANGIKIGAYVYIYASTPEEARKEAEYAISLMKEFNITYPVAFDLEEDEHMTTAAKLNNMAMADAFCSTMAAAGYKTMVYGSPSKLTSAFDYTKISAAYDIWLARYRWPSEVIQFSDKAMRDEVYNTGYEGGNWTNLSNVKIWQYSDCGRVSGISGNVDLDIGYKVY